MAPFALLSPCAGVLSSALIFGEIPPPIRYAGMALIVAGLIVSLNPRRVAAARPVSAATRGSPSPP